LRESPLPERGCLSRSVPPDQAGLNLSLPCSFAQTGADKLRRHLACPRAAAGTAALRQKTAAPGIWRASGAIFG